MTAPGSRTVGRVRPVVRHGHPALHRRCAEVTAFDAPLRQLVADLHVSMAAADGVGLAANQLGVDARVFVVDCPDAAGRRVVAHVVNPVLLPAAPGLGAGAGAGAGTDDDEEGCLSVPGPYAVLRRAATAVVTGVDADGAPVRIEGDGLLARCLQHEVDHLDGVVYVDRLGWWSRRRVLRAADLRPAATTGADTGPVRGS